MGLRDFLRKHGINADIELVINIIMLIIPGLRFVGAFWMYSRIQRKYGFIGFQKFLLFILALMVATGALAEILTDVIWPLAIAAAFGAASYLLYSKRQDHMGELQAYLAGKDACSLDQISDALGLSEKRIERYVTKLKNHGRLPDTVYIDRISRTVVLMPEGGQKSKKTAKVEHTQNSNAKGQPESSAPREKSKYEKILYQIRYINEQIEDSTMTGKIYHIENTTANIFHLVEQKPERENEIQTFMEYYLPTTMNLLYKYSQLEKQSDINSENMKASKQSIEGIMDKLVEGFDTQLDKLFKSDAIDITNDIKVLEKMMQMDKLNK